MTHAPISWRVFFGEHAYIACAGLFHPGNVFAYGQTAAGKTYTMMGGDRQPGIIELMLDDVFRLAGNVSYEYIVRTNS